MGEALSSIPGLHDTVLQPNFAKFTSGKGPVKYFQERGGGFPFCFLMTVT